MAETFDYKEGFRQGWSTLWTIMSGIDLLMDYIPQRRKNDALTTALTHMGISGFCISVLR